MGRLDGKVAFITGAARGQGRAHAVRLAEEGASIIAVDICEQIDTVSYELGTMDELQETAKLVEDRDQRIVVAKADVRDRASMQSAVDKGIAEFGRLDIVSANAGIWSSAAFVDLDDQMYRDMIDVQMTGPWNTCKVTVPYLIEQDEGGSIIITSSVAGKKGFPHQAHYNMGKAAAILLMRTLANELAPNRIRVNTVNPFSTITKMIDNEFIWRAFAPDAENPSSDDMAGAMQAMNLLPIPWVQPEDISAAVAWLASDDARYVTGIDLDIDAGFMAKV